MRKKPPPAPAPASGGAHEVDVLVSVGSAPKAPKIALDCRRLLEASTRARRLTLSVLLCGDVRMRRLNREYREKDRPTDVLSFPSGAPLETGAFLGDLVVDVPYAARQARRRGHATAREVSILLAHGILHLLGHDHEKDDGEMFRLQRRLVTKVFGPGPDGVPVEG